MKLKELLKGQMNKTLIERIENMHSFDIAKEFNDLSEEEKQILYTVLSTEKFADIISYLDTLEAADFLQQFELDVQSKIIDEMTTDDAVDILQEYDDDDRNKIVETLELVDNIKEYLKYEENETGAYMTSEYVIINDQLDVKEGVTSLIKQAPDAESINHLFLVDNQGIYSGTISLKDLVKARSPKLVKDLIEPFPTLLDTLNIEQSVRNMKNYNLLTMPVLNSKNELVGILTIDDVLDIITDEAREDYAKMASVSEIDSEAGVLKTAWHRLPWLIILLILGIPIALLTGSIGGVVASISLLILFEPLLLDTPGNVATQTLAVNLQSIYKTGKINKGTVFNELISGLYNGLLLGAAAFVISYLVMTIKKPVVPEAFSILSTIKIKLIFSSILSLSIVVTVSIAPLIASFVPWILTKFKVDPAVSSGSFIITLIDIFAVSIYFLIANGLISLAGVIL
ncbi:MAG: magnesium transporter [Acholeplasmataceae bacterium]|jgi:magnesium transporter|nr:magnesium transporter [Acholeplasmataceae bacterium]